MPNRLPHRCGPGTSDRSDPRRLSYRIYRPPAEVSIFHALVLGLVQGLTEFIPVSSSGHLVIVPALLGWPRAPVAFDIYLHGATLLAVLLYFQKELVRLATGWRQPGPERRLILLLAIATIPAAVAGALFEDRVSRVFADPVGVSLLLIGTGVILVVSEVIARRRSASDQPDLVDGLAAQASPANALAIGAAQAIAILPGFSRSGWTIGAGLLTGLERPLAAKFSFLMSIPILAGAIAVKLPELSGSGISAGALAAGGIAAFVSAYASIAGLIDYLQRRGLLPFAAYCLVAGPIYALVLR